MNKNNLMLILLFVVALMSVAFAALSTSLSITGTGTIDSKWGPIYITKCACKATTIKDSSNPPTATCTPTTNSSSSTVSGAITADMKLPGDKVACTFTVKNDGTLHTAAPVIKVDSNTYFSVTSEHNPLMAGSTGIINVIVEYKSETSTSQTITLTADYKQAATTNTTKSYTTVS